MPCVLCVASLQALRMQFGPLNKCVMSLALQIRLGPLTPHAVRTLLHVKDFLRVQFDLEAEEDSRTIFGTCVGAGLKNLARKTD